MRRKHRDAQLLAEAHRESCPMGRHCRNECPEASPLYWARALEDQPMPPQARHDVLIATPETVVEEQLRVIEDAALLVEEFNAEGGPLDEFLAAMKAVLNRPMNGA